MGLLLSSSLRCGTVIRAGTSVPTPAGEEPSPITRMCACSGAAPAFEERQAGLAHGGRRIAALFQPCAVELLHPLARHPIVDRPETRDDGRDAREVEGAAQ